jgi:hypothetical protein
LNSFLDETNLKMWEGTMLEAWVIERIEQERREKEGVREDLYIPLEAPVYEPSQEPEEASPPPSDRGVVVIDL